mmetsp:Transcript_30145/g.47259  ORF Transcript_30145/g.47259 Transcript_30145/m.47259 type:complete len:300 (+) Transcript_30145:208-1107(+)
MGKSKKSRAVAADQLLQPKGSGPKSTKGVKSKVTKVGASNVPTASQEKGGAAPSKQPSRRFPTRNRRLDFTEDSQEQSHNVQQEHPGNEPVEAMTIPSPEDQGSAQVSKDAPGGKVVKAKRKYIKKTFVPLEMSPQTKARRDRVCEESVLDAQSLHQVYAKKVKERNEEIPTGKPRSLEVLRAESEDKIIPHSCPSKDDLVLHCCEYNEVFGHLFQTTRQVGSVTTRNDARYFVAACGQQEDPDDQPCEHEIAYRHDLETGYWNQMRPVKPHTCRRTLSVTAPEGEDGERVSETLVEIE